MDASRNTTRIATLYWAATAMPAGLVLCGALFGGVWAWAGMVWLTGVVTVLDEAEALVAPDPNMLPGLHRILPIALGCLHFVVLAAVIWALAKAPYGMSEKLALFVAAGLFFGQISNANAHDLIHRPQRRAVALGRWVYASLLFGHHASAHPLVHHIHVATAQDPNSAPLGRGFYRYFIKAWIGSYRAGYRAETARRTRAGTLGLHPYAFYALASATCLAGAYAIGGALGVLALWAVAGYAQVQLLLSDYVQHYGLRRAVGADGRPEPVGPIHSWNARHTASALMMLQAPRHSDHHVRPWRPFPALTLPPAHIAPRLPYALPVMAAIALIPPLWRRIMDPLAAEWQSTPEAWQDVAA